MNAILLTILCSILFNIYHDSIIFFPAFAQGSIEDIRFWTTPSNLTNLTNLTTCSQLKEKKKINAVMTYYDKSIKKYDDRLIYLWSSRQWEDCGWNTTVLNLDDAKNHSLFEEFNARLEKANISWTSRQGFFRYLAMSTVKEGGFFSELYLFPLERASNLTSKGTDDQFILPNKGNFTCYDADTSLLSGSYKEWNRITILLMENIENNAIWSFWKIRISNPASINRQFISYGVELNITGKEFDMNICNHKYIVRFNIAKIKYPVSYILSWFKIRNARCLSNRPLMFTFFQPKDYFRDEHRNLLEVWGEAWSDAGWEPVILNLGDAMRYPKYDQFLRKLLVHVNGTRFYDGQGKYNLYCYLRWVAMASVGGGWMSDFDTLPLYSKPSFTLPNNGYLSIYNDHVPNLVSGSAAEWNRMAVIMFDNYIKNSNNGTEFWSDMLEMYFIMTNSLMKGKPLNLRESTEILHVYNIDKTMMRERIMDPYNLDEFQCHYLKGLRAIHFSHHVCRLVEFCEGFGERPPAIRLWYQSFVEYCKYNVAINHDNNV